ncbi:shikimate dehydrogenase family protein [Pseudorhizobium marinum]|uniref:shikimate dehydrogenase family protein n=1 Tax=Pseudorhizobium marinum TaxID=1496690 RepID=UPI0009DFF283|nr:shikimate dehydrogenase [Pseudorhizobium marinum]
MATENVSCRRFSATLDLHEGHRRSHLLSNQHIFFGLVGYPITFVRSPGLMNTYLAEHGLPGHMIPFAVRPEALQAALAGLRHLENLRGFFVTMPFKESILPLLDDLSEPARISGAVNIVRRAPDGRFFGHQLDGAGFVGAMMATGVTIAGASAHVAGAGGVSAGICYALAQTGISRITIANRNRDRGEKLADRLRGAFPKTVFAVTSARPDREVDIVVNATSLGLSSDDPLPVDLAATRPGIFVGDVVNVPHLTPFLEAAAARGCRIQHGKAMFAPQIELALRFYETGV